MSQCNIESFWPAHYSISISCPRNSYPRKYSVLIMIHACDSRGWISSILYIVDYVSIWNPGSARRYLSMFCCTVQVYTNAQSNPLFLADKINVCSACSLSHLASNSDDAPPSLTRCCCQHQPFLLGLALAFWKSKSFLLKLLFSGEWVSPVFAISCFFDICEGLHEATTWAWWNRRLNPLNSAGY